MSHDFHTLPSRLNYHKSEMIMSTQLTQYFERYAENAIAQMKEALIAVGYYERIRQRLLKNEDLSAE